MRLWLVLFVIVLAVGDTPAVAKKPKSLLDSLLVPAAPQVTFTRGTHPALPPDVMSPAQTDRASGTIYYSQPLSKFARAHEVAHLLDAQVLSDGDRRFFQRLMHAPSGEWRQGSAADTRGGPSEWFADYYAFAALGIDPRRSYEDSYATVGPKRLLRFQKALDRLGRRHGLRPYK